MDNIHPGAMPWLHRYVGNPVLSGILNVFFRTGVKDAHCGMRALPARRPARRSTCAPPGMEFASEMVIRAAKEDLDIRQLPIEYHPRGGESKLSSFRDGWRHLRFLLVHSPTHLFVIPGGADGARRARSSRSRWSRSSTSSAVSGTSTRMIAGALLLIVGTQVLGARAVRARLRHLLHGRARPVVRPGAGEVPPRARAPGRAGRSCSWASALAVGILVTWLQRGFGELSEARLGILAATLIIVGIQVVFSSFLLSILGLRRRV